VRSVRLRLSHHRGIVTSFSQLPCLCAQATRLQSRVDVCGTSLRYGVNEYGPKTAPGDEDGRAPAAPHSLRPLVGASLRSRRCTRPHRPITSCEPDLRASRYQLSGRTMPLRPAGLGPRKPGAPSYLGAVPDQSDTGRGLKSWRPSPGQYVTSLSLGTKLFQSVRFRPKNKPLRRIAIITQHRARFNPEPHE